MAIVLKRVIFTYFPWISTKQDANDPLFSYVQGIFRSSLFNSTIQHLTQCMVLLETLFLPGFGDPTFFRLPFKFLMTPVSLCLVCKVLSLFCHPWSVGSLQVESQQALKLLLTLCILSLENLLSSPVSATFPMLRTTETSRAPEPTSAGLQNSCLVSPLNHVAFHASFLHK